MRFLTRHIVAAATAIGLLGGAAAPSQAEPTLLKFAYAGTPGDWVITGALNSAPNTTYTLQFFASATADPSGYGEGQTLIGTTTVTTDSFGNAPFAATFTGQVVPAGDAVSATATDPSGNTSEFALDVTAAIGTEPNPGTDRANANGEIIRHRPRPPFDNLRHLPSRATAAPD